MIVLKFGGSSIKDSHAIQSVADIIHSKLNQHPVVVLSACGDTTDNLLHAIDTARSGDLAHALQEIDAIHNHHLGIVNELSLQPSWESNFTKISEAFLSELQELLRGVSLLNDISAKSIDRIISFGERYSTLLLNCLFNSQDVRAHLADSCKFIKTTGKHTNAKPLLDESRPLIRSTFRDQAGRYSIPIAQGFIGSTIDGATTTLGRGGSDYTASIIGAALGVDAIEIWSDVDGILTADPTIISHAQAVRQMTFREASELAYFGARVLHPDTILPAVEHDIPIYIYNTMNPDAAGSLIRREFPDKAGKSIVKSIAYKEGIQVLNLTSTRMFQAHDFLRKVFEVLDRHEVVADLVSTSEVSISIAFPRNVNHQPLVQELSKFSTVNVESRKAIVCLVGEHMQNHKGLAGKIFHQLQDVHINMISQGASEVNLSFVIDEKDIEKVVRKLHATFFPIKQRVMKRVGIGR